jgi:hypothetical protein
MPAGRITSWTRACPDSPFLLVVGDQGARLRDHRLNDPSVEVVLIAMFTVGRRPYGISLTRVRRLIALRDEQRQQAINDVDVSRRGVGLRSSHLDDAPLEVNVGPREFAQLGVPKPRETKPSDQALPAEAPIVLARSRLVKSLRSV